MGDSLYEVMYDVVYFGYYVICIKYGEEEIVESFFLVCVIYEYFNWICVGLFDVGFYYLCIFVIFWCVGLIVKIMLNFIF